MADPQEVVKELTGQTWERLFAFLDHGQQEPPILTASSQKRLPCDVKRVPTRDMNLFGHHPEDDPFALISCLICDMLVLPFALRRHIINRHGKEALADLHAKTAKTTLTPVKKSKTAPVLPKEDNLEEVICSLCSLTVRSSAFRQHTLKVHGDDSSAKPLILSAALKTKTVKKTSPSKKSTSKSASASPPELNEDISKDVKKSKNKKCRSPVPPELEPILPEAGKRTVMLGGPPELVPADLPKKSSKKKADKKTDKIFDPNKHCGVINETGKPCTRTILCKVHLVAHKRAVQNRSMPYDTLTKIIKSQNEEDRRPKLEVQTMPIVSVDKSPPMSELESTEVWPEPPEIVKEVNEPDIKRVKTEEIEELPSHIEALIEATLQETSIPLPEEESPAMLPVTPRPLVRWSLEAPMSPPTPPPPPYAMADLPWQPSHPRPLATNTFGCRLVGGLLTKNKTLDEFRKHVQSVWGSPTANQEPKASTLSAKFGVLSPAKKPVVIAQKRKRKSSGSSSGGGGATADLFSGFLQRAAAANAASAASSATSPPNGVNGVPIRVYNNNLTSSPSSFIQLCPSK